ncbi:SAM hydrolase/SAM-dependent halogenase family protein [Paraburkholderia kururiensis]|uniref:SAM hydrolase/SAM-dependent halogenase family protein n=1 Tax=Paraburkholderia kururiensis TaxID=984307 RepID=UPI000AFC80F2|nr:SAM-dependent chlorinase/fluorinase [Paraburkholderia kururiensis]
MMIALFTDFGADDIYVGQMKAALLSYAGCDVHLVDALHNVPDYDARAAAHLLAALHGAYPDGTVFLAVVDPGVGSAREPVAVMTQVDGKTQWFVGPDNGLLSVIAARASRAKTFRIAWRPAALSASFHGRDLFAPVAAWLASGEAPADKLEETGALRVQLDAGDLAEIIYVDHYGNALTGMRAAAVADDARLRVAQTEVTRARVFSDVPEGQAFWYVNSIGLVEIAVNRGSATAQLGLRPGHVVEVLA